MIWTFGLRFWQLETRPCGRASRINILELFALILLNFIYLAKIFVTPAILLVINWYLQARLRSWWNINAFCSSFSWFPHSSSFSFHWLSPTPLKPVSLTYILAESIWEHLVLHSLPSALVIPVPACHCLALYHIQCLPCNHLHCYLDDGSRHSS